MGRAIITRSRRKDQPVGAVRLLVEQIEKALLRADKVESKLPSAFENLAARRLRFSLIGFFVTVLLNSQGIAQTALRQSCCHQTWGRVWPPAQRLPKDNTQEDQNNHSAEHPQTSRTGSRDRCPVLGYSFAPAVRLRTLDPDDLRGRFVPVPRRLHGAPRLPCCQVSRGAFKLGCELQPLLQRHQIGQ